MDFQNYILNFIKHYGYEGVFIVGFTQSIIQPIPVLPFVLLSKTLGLNPWLVVLIGIISNTLGAMVSYWLGYFIGDNLIGKVIFEKHFLKAKAMFNKYGMLAIFIGEPYKVICWVSGILRFPFLKFIIVTFLSRIIHTLFYLLLSYLTHTLFYTSL